MNIVIIDDDVLYSSSICRQLKQYGVITTTFMNGIDAVEWLGEHSPDCVIVDMFLPGPNGMVVIHELQSHDDMARIPIIIWSNHAEKLRSAPLRQYGVMAVLDKTSLTHVKLYQTLVELCA